MSIPQNNLKDCNYKDIMSFEDRKKRSNSLLLKYQDKFPVILEKSKKDKYLPRIDKSKLLVSHDMTIATIIQLLKKNIKVNENTAIYIMTMDKLNNEVMLSGSQSISYIYNNYKSDDGFLYLEYCTENVFG